MLMLVSYVYCNICAYFNLYLVFTMILDDISGCCLFRMLSCIVLFHYVTMSSETSHNILIDCDFFMEHSNDLVLHEKS